MLDESGVPISAGPSNCPMCKCDLDPVNILLYPPSDLQSSASFEQNVVLSLIGLVRGPKLCFASIAAPASAPHVLKWMSMKEPRSQRPSNLPLHRSLQHP